MLCLLESKQDVEFQLKRMWSGNILSNTHTHRSLFHIGTRYSTFTGRKQRAHGGLSSVRGRRILLCDTKQPTGRAGQALCSTCTSTYSSCLRDKHNCHASQFSFQIRCRQLIHTIFNYTSIFSLIGTYTTCNSFHYSHVDFQVLY